VAPRSLRLRRGYSSDRCTREIDLVPNRFARLATAKSQNLGLLLGIVAPREILRRVLQIHIRIQRTRTDPRREGRHGRGRPCIRAEKRSATGVDAGSRKRLSSGSISLAVIACRTREIASAPSSLDVLGPLSKREREIFRLAADCRTSAEIANHLCLARKTVDTHLNRINRKLQLQYRAELVRLAASVGLVHSLRRRDPHPAHRNAVAPICDNEPAHMAGVDSTGMPDRVAVTGAHRAKEVGWPPARGDDVRRRSVER
jgi:DNA-binding CsgD family transcriptional regulator